MTSLERRAREIRSRCRVRDWEYRQRALAKGVWTRLRRVLAAAESAYSISESEASALIAEGACPQPVGAQIAPAKRIFFVPRDRLDSLPSRRQIAVRLDAEFLAARAVALVRFE
jgi:hypothetical protein